MGLLFSCSSGGRKDRAQLRKLFLTGQYDQAISFIDQSKFYQKEDSKLLRFLEKGILYHVSGEWEKSFIELTKAKDYYRNLYTKSISDKVQTLMANDNYDLYYGSAYERSLINYYNAINCFQIYQNNGDRKYLFKARAEILDWDSFQNTRLQVERGNSVFKVDLMSKILGAAIHETIGSKEELQIAELLYKDTDQVLFRYYNAYKTFNEKFKDFKRDYEKLPKLSPKKVKTGYIEETSFQTEVKEYILKQQKRLKKNDLVNVMVSFESGIIPQKEAKLEYFNLEKALRLNSDSTAAKAFSRVGSQVLMIFAADKLGLIPPPTNYNPIGTHLGIQLAAMSAEGLAVSFELPYVNANPVDYYSSIIFKNKDKEIKEKITLINSYADIAEEAVIENSLDRYFRLGVRLATKHLAAIFAAFTTYQSSKASLGEGMAKIAALAQYATTIEVIKNSERADTRQWSLVPEHVHFAQLKLAPGEYEVQIEKTDLTGQVKQIIPFGNHKINEQKQLLSFRNF